MSATLYYFDGRGKAETIRLTMAATGIKFDQVDITEKDQFHKMISDGRLLFKQLPMIEFEGKNMVQSGSTTRFFARRGHLLGETEDEIYKIDCLYEGTRDLMSLFMRYGFDDYKVALDKAKNLGMARMMPIFEKELEKNGSNGYLVGNKLTLADIGLLEVFLTIDELLGAQEFDPYPNIQKFFTTIKSIPNIAAYLSSPQRRRMNDDKYIAEVNRVIK